MPGRWVSARSHSGGNSINTFFKYSVHFETSVLAVLLLMSILASVLSSLSYFCQICRKYKLSEAVAFLLERTGDIQGAFNILYEVITMSEVMNSSRFCILYWLSDLCLFMQHLQSKMQDLVAVLGGLNSEMGLYWVLLVQVDYTQTCNQYSAWSELFADSAVCWDKVLESLHMVIQLCQRNSPKLDEVQREVSHMKNIVCLSVNLWFIKRLMVSILQSLWFPILEACMAPQRQLKDRMDSSTIEGDLFMLVNYSMLQFVRYSVIHLPSSFQGNYPSSAEQHDGIHCIDCHSAKNHASELNSVSPEAAT